MLKFLWPLRQANSPALSIPNYMAGRHEDSIDLQVKSLMYMYKRYNISRLASFLQLTENGEYKMVLVEDEDEELSEDEDLAPQDHDDKLDIIYNKAQFELVLLRDEHRILIDYIKNKFRAMLILSDYPKELKELPAISDDVSYKFSVLRPEASDEEYIQVLLNESNFYIEHNVSDDLKIELITTILYDQRALKSRLDKDDRAFIISSYLKQLAFHIQVDRIYKATLRSKEKLSLLDQPDLKPDLKPSHALSHPQAPKSPTAATKQVSAKQSFIKSQPTENSYVTKPVPLFLTSPTVKYQSPSRRKQGSPVLEKSPVLKSSSKVTIYDDSMEEKATPQLSPSSSPQRTLRASPSRMKLRPAEHVVMQLPPLPPLPQHLLSTRSPSPPRLNTKLSRSILKFDTKYQEQVLSGLHAGSLGVPKRRRNSANSSSASDFSDSGSHATSLTTASAENPVLVSQADREALYDQSKAAVKIRVERERNYILGKT